jgi:hypothetical protein
MSFEQDSTLATLESAIFALREQSPEHIKEWLTIILGWFGINPMAKELWLAFRDQGFGNMRSSKLARIYPVLEKGWPELAHQAGVQYLSKYKYDTDNTANTIVKALWRFVGKDYMEEVLTRTLQFRSSVVGFPVNNSLFDAWLTGGWQNPRDALELLERHGNSLKAMVDLYPNDSDRAKTQFYLAMLYFEAAHGPVNHECTNALNPTGITAGGKRWFDLAISSLLRNQNHNAGGIPGIYKLTNALEMMIKSLTDLSYLSCSLALAQLRGLAMTIARKIKEAGNTDGIMADIALAILRQEIRINRITQLTTCEFILELAETNPESLSSMINLRELIALQAKTPLLGCFRERILQVLDKLLQSNSKVKDLRRFFMPLFEKDDVPEEMKEVIREIIVDGSITRPELSELLDTGISRTGEMEKFTKSKAEVLKNLNNDRLDSSLANLLGNDKAGESYLFEQIEDIMIQTLTS